MCSHRGRSLISEVRIHLMWVSSQEPPLGCHCAQVQYSPRTHMSIGGGGDSGL